MIGKILDINQTDAYINFNDGTTFNVGISHLPKNVHIGDMVDIDISNIKMSNDKLISFF